MAMKSMTWAGHDLVSLYGEGLAGRTPGEQLSDIFADFDQELSGIGLSLDNGVRHRLWTRTREAREASNDIRAQLITGNRRCATSSFISRDVISSAGDVAVEMIAQVPAAVPVRRLVDFSPPRRYARYLVQIGRAHV